MTLLNRESILKADDLPRERVHIEEWGGDVYVRALTAEERDAYEASMINFIQQPDGEMKREMNLANAKARMAVRCTVDESGNRLFKDSDAMQLGRKSNRAVSRITQVCQRLSGMSEEEVKKIEGNSERTPAAVSALG